MWAMSATAVIFLVYSLGKLQSQYLIESSVVVEPKDGEGRRVLSLVKLYDKHPPAPGDTPKEAGEQQAGAVYQRSRRDSRVRKLLKKTEGYVPPGDHREESNTGELDELDGYNYFMVSEEEMAVQQQQEKAEAARRLHRAQRRGPGMPYRAPPPLGVGGLRGGESLTNKKNGWFDHPPNVEFHNELKQDFKEFNNAKVSDSALKQLEQTGGDSNKKPELKFLYIDEHGNKVYGSSFKKPAFQPLQININRGQNVAQFDQGPSNNAESNAELKKNSNDIIRQYVEQNIKRRKSERKEEKPAYKTLHLYVTTNGRFGNHLFQYASLYGLARATNRIPLLPKGTELSEIFVKSRFSITEDTAPHDITMVHETNSGVYSPGLYNLPPEDVLVCCYLQSWKYFNNYKTMINHLFRFQRAIRERAAELLADAEQMYLRKNPAVYNGQYTPKLTYVGTHVRRGDYMLKEHLDRGYRPAPLAYLRKAMDYYRSKFSHTVFVVSSDDLSWCVQHLNFSDVAFVSGVDHGVDLATLASCNHTIMTVGTFGWWAGWLAGGEVVYYRDWIAPGSDLAGRYNAQDYFLPDWKPIGDQ